MPKSSTLSLAMRGKPKDNGNTPMSPRSPRSPDLPEEFEYAAPNAAFHNMPQSPASPKPRKDSKSIFANFSANKSSSRLNNSQGNPMRQQQPSPSLYSNGRSGASTPDLGRPVRTPNSDGKAAELLTNPHVLIIVQIRAPKWYAWTSGQSLACQTNLTRTPTLLNAPP